MNSSNILSFSGFLFFTAVNLVIAWYGFSQKTSVWPYALPIGVIFSSLIAFFCWNSIDFSHGWYARSDGWFEGFFERIAAIGFYIIYFIVVLFFTVKYKMWAWLLSPGVLGALALAGYALILIHKYQELDSKKFAERMPDYVEALKAGDLEKISSAIEKYKNNKIYYFYLLDHVNDGDRKTIKFLVEKGICDVGCLEEYVKRFYGQNANEDLEILKLMTRKSLSAQSQYKVKEFFTKFRHDFLGLNLSHAIEMLDMAREVKFDNLAIASTSNSPGFVVAVLSSYQGNFAHFKKRTEEYFSEVDKYSELIKYLWTHRNDFATSKEVDEFETGLKSTIQLSEPNAYRNEPSTAEKEQLAYLNKSAQKLLQWIKESN